jgi:predicted Zn-dependent peptidase
VRSLNRDHLLDYVNSRYTKDNVIISCAGNFDEEMLLKSLNRALEGFDRKLESPGVLERAGFMPGASIIKKDLSEAHICIGVEGIRQSSDERYSALLLNAALGGGISSRLFQEIREKRGLAYSVYSFLSSYLDAGIWGIYAGTSPERAEEVVRIIINELGRLVETLSEDEVERARTQLKGNILLGLESTSRRMQNIANQEIYYGRYYSPEEVMERIDSAGIEEVREIGRALLEAKSPRITALGQLDTALEGKWSEIRI